MKNVTQADLGEFLNGGRLVVLKFSAPWCGPCKMMGPMLEAVEKDEKYQDIHFAEVNIDEQPGIAASFNVRSVPTLMGFDNGQVSWVKVGLQPLSSLNRIFSDFSEGRPVA